MPPAPEPHRRFAFRHTLGRGGFGEVYLAEMTAPSGLSSTVAVKVLHGGLDPRSQAVQRLKDEARILSLLNHPSIVGIHDLAILDDRIAMVTEFVEGADLPDCLDGPDPMPLGAVLEVWAAVAGALDAAHRATDGSGRPLGLLHRDVKPRNVRVGKHGQVKLLDFGIATGTGFDRDANTQTGALVGSFPYVAPERFRRGTPATTASDVYSLGCSLAECLPRARRELVFEAPDVAGFVAMKVDRAQHDARVGEFLAGVPDEPAGLHAALRRLLAYEASERPTCTEVQASLEDLAAAAGGARLNRWARGRVWPDVEPEPGGLSGQTVTESTGSGPTDTSHFDLVVHTPAPAPRAAPVAPAPSPSRAAEPERGGIGALALGALTVGGVGGLAAIALLALVGVGLVGWLAVSAGPGAPPEPVPVGSDPQPAPDPQPTPDPVVPAPADTDAPAPVPQPPPVGAPGPTPEPTGGVPAPEPPAPDVPAPTAPRPVSSTSEAPCGPLDGLEAPASAGELRPNDRACLGLAVKDLQRSLTSRRDHARVLLVDAKKRCDTANKCVDYEREQIYYFDALGQYDPDMMLGWARYQFDRANYEETRRWVGRALERKQSWGQGQVYLQRMEAATQLDALAAEALWKADTRSDPKRLATRDAAIEWAIVLTQRKKPADRARALCLAASGGGDVCDQRLPDAAAKARVTLASIPAGLEVRVDGRVVGSTPRTEELSFGSHTVEVTGPSGTSSRQIEVGGATPNHWTFTASDGGWSGVVR